MVVTFIEVGGSDISGESCLGCPPLSWAARNGHQEVVQIRLKMEGVNSAKPDNGSYTPLSHATLNGHEEGVKILPEWEEVNPDKSNISGPTPLSYATQEGHDKILALLQSCNAASPCIT